MNPTDQWSKLLHINLVHYQYHTLNLCVEGHLKYDKLPCVMEYTHSFVIMYLLFLQ